MMMMSTCRLPWQMSCNFSFFEFKRHLLPLVVVVVVVVVVLSCLVPPLVGSLLSLVLVAPPPSLLLATAILYLGSFYWKKC
jgi:hypothetical protein